MPYGDVLPYQAGRYYRDPTSPSRHNPEVPIWLHESRVDYTSFFRALASAARGDIGPVRALFADPQAAEDWVARWRALEPDGAAMDSVNPLYIPRNHLVEEALAAAVDGDLGPVERLLAVVTATYDERPGQQRFAAPAPPDFGAYRTFCGT